MKAIRSNYPLPFIDILEVQQSANSSEEQLDIFINEWNQNQGSAATDARVGAVDGEISISTKKSSEALGLRIQENYFQRQKQSSYANLQSALSSSNQLSPSTRSLASHISMDSLRRRAMMETRIRTDDDDDNDSVVSSISTHKESIPSSRKSKHRNVCICGAVKSRRSKLKPSSYRYYDENGNCVIQAKDDSVREVGSFESLEAHESSRTSAVDSDGRSVDAENVRSETDKKSGFWGFFKF